MCVLQYVNASFLCWVFLYSHVHKAGGLCVVDEVQTGFGRGGDHFWIFQSQGVCVCVCVRACVLYIVCVGVDVLHTRML